MHRLRFMNMSTEQIDLNRLTKTEKEVWRLIVKGNSGQEIADKRGTTKSAVWNMARIIYAKMGVKDQTHLILQAWRKK